MGSNAIFTKIRHRACAQACKGVLVTLREVTSSFSVLVIFFDFSAFGGSRIPPVTLPALPRPSVHPPQLRYGFHTSGIFEVFAAYLEVFKPYLRRGRNFGSTLPEVWFWNFPAS